MNTLFCGDVFDCMGRALGLAGAIGLLAFGLWLLIIRIASLPREWRRWRTTRGIALCAKGKHAWVDRRPQGDEWLLPWLRPVRCSRCNVRARLSH